MGFLGLLNIWMESDIFELSLSSGLLQDLLGDGLLVGQSIVDRNIENGGKGGALVINRVGLRSKGTSIHFVELPKLSLDAQVVLLLEIVVVELKVVIILGLVPPFVALGSAPSWGSGRLWGSV